MRLACSTRVRPIADTAGTASGQGRRGGGARRRRVGTALLATLCALGAGAAGAQAQPTPGPPQVIDGPSPAIVGPTGLTSSIARDGTDGLVYLKQAAGTAHVYLSILQGGVFQPPVQLDAGLVSPSSQPVIAAGDNGALIVAFVNAAGLYVSQRTSTASTMSTHLLASPAQNPSLQMTTFGKAYLAFTMPDGAGTDVRAAYYYAGTWAVESAPFNATPGDDAGAGDGRPAVAAAGDGVGIVAWGENGHIMTRRVWGTALSVVTEQADGPLPGCTEVSADEPAIGSGGDSSYAAVAFHEALSCAGQTESRVLSNRLHGSIYDGIRAADGLSTPTTDGADQPAVVASEFGTGWVTSDRTTSFDVGAQWLNGGESPAATQKVNSLADATNPEATPALAGFFSSLIAWQHDPGPSGQAEIRLRFADSGGTLGPELVLSSPAQGPTDATAGLTAAGNVSGEAAVAWVQSAPSGNEIVADQLYQTPGAPVPQAPTGYVRTTSPTLVWLPSSELWGPVRYTVTLDGAQLGQTAATTLPLTAPLGQGPHTWQLTASNAAGLTSGVRTGRMFVDTNAPQATLQLLGKRYVGTLLKLHVRDTDTPPGLPAGDGSGIALVVVRWGDRTTDTIHHWSVHTYKRPGRYRITVTVVDRAGNVTRVSLVVKVVKPPKPRRKHTPAKSKKPHH